MKAEDNPLIRGILDEARAKADEIEKASEKELVEMLPHRWILSHPEATISDIRKQAN